MTTVQVLTAPCAIDLSYSDSLPRYQEKFNWAISKALIPPSSVKVTVDISTEEEISIFPSLPPLRQGHPEVHMRDGVMKAAHLAETHQPDAEKAFFVADLSQVYRQHKRWVAALPEVQPFYGE